MSNNIKFAAILSFMGQTRDRFQVWGPAYTLEEKFARAARVENLGAVEIVYPQEFGDVAKTKRLLDEHNLVCSTVNVNIKTEPVFHMGSLTHPDANVRKESTWALQRLGQDDEPAAPDEPPEKAAPREAPADLDDADEVLRRSDELIARLMREASESKKKKGNPKPKPSPVRRRNRRSRRRVLEVSEDDSARGRARLPTLPRGASA